MDENCDIYKETYRVCLFEEKSISWIRDFKI